MRLGECGAMDTHLSEWRVFDVGGVDGGCVCVHDHQLTVLDGQPGRVLLLLDVSILTPDHVHHGLLQLLHIKRTVCVCVCVCVCIVCLITEPKHRPRMPRPPSEGTQEDDSSLVLW